MMVVEGIRGLATEVWVKLDEGVAALVVADSKGT